MAPIRPRLRRGQLSAAEGFPRPEEGKSKPGGRKIQARGKENQRRRKEKQNPSFPKSEPFQRVAPTSGLRPLGFVRRFHSSWRTHWPLIRSPHATGIWR